MESPFRIVNFVNLGNGKSYGFTEQIFNPKYGSFTLIHIVEDNFEPEIAASLYSILPLDGRYIIPSYYAGDMLTYPWLQSTITWLKTNGYMDSSGNMPKIKAWIDEWLRTGYLSPEMENVPVLARTIKFPTK